jgi:hypothetical protein
VPQSSSVARADLSDLAVGRAARADRRWRAIVSTPPTIPIPVTIEESEDAANEYPARIFPVMAFYSQ